MTSPRNFLVSLIERPVLPEAVGPTMAISLSTLFLRGLMDMGDSARGALFQALPVFGHARAFFLLPPLGFDSIGLMGHIRRIGLILIIIAFLPYLAMAHEGEVHFSVDPTVLPGHRGYAWERVSEWFSLNILTISAKGKQEKKLDFAEERLPGVMGPFVLLV